MKLYRIILFTITSLCVVFIHGQGIEIRADESGIYLNDKLTTCSELLLDVEGKAGILTCSN